MLESEKRRTYACPLIAQIRKMGLQTSVDLVQTIPATVSDATRHSGRAYPDQ